MTREEPKPFDWRGKNIQWVRLQGTSLRFKVITAMRGGLVFATIYDSLNKELKGYEFLEEEEFEKYEWSEDNKTWRKFE